MKTRGHSLEQLNLVRTRFFDRHAPHIILDPTLADGLQITNFCRIDIPARFLAEAREIDLSLAFHEMGHLVTLPERRIVRPGFGFANGVPILIGGEWHRMPLGASSAKVEAMAMAWEHILLRDVLGITVEMREICSSLQHASDFQNYKGDTTAEKIDWVTAMAEAYATDYGTSENFEAAWHERCERLPTLFAQEDERFTLLERAPNQIDRWTFPEDSRNDWIFELSSYEGPSVSAFCVSVSSDQAFEPLVETFDSQAEAYRWIRHSIRAHSDDPQCEPCPQAEVASPSMVSAGC